MSEEEELKGERTHEELEERGNMSEEEELEEWRKRGIEKGEDTGRIGVEGKYE